MADEKVSIKVKIHANTRELKSAIAQMSALKKMERRFASGRAVENYAQSTAGSIATMAKKWKRSFDQIDAAVKFTGKFLMGFLKFAIKAVIVEMALLSATMVGVHALFVAGKFIMKAYHGAMQVLAGGAAAAGMAIGTVAAAIREQQAAMFAYRGKGAAQFGSSMRQTQMAMRTLQSDIGLASLGVENLNKAFGVMSKTMNVTQINASGKAIKALMDFGSAGQDPAKGLEQVAAVIAALSDSKKSVSDVIAEAKKLGPEMEKALSGVKVKNKKDFENLLFSGELAKKGGVAGQFEAVNTTLISQLKAYFGVIKSEFADFGELFLEPVKVAFEEIFYIIRRDLTRASTTIQQAIGFGAFTGGFVGAIDKTSNWMIKMLREYLPRAQGMFERMGDWFFRFRRGWNLLLEKLRPLIDGARVLYKAWDPIWEAIKRGADNLTLFRSLLLDNKDDVMEFGERIGDFIDAFSTFMQNLKKMFADMAPFINDLLSGLNQIFKILSKMFTFGAGGGLGSALAPLFGFAALSRGMMAAKGMFMPQAGKINQMNVAANTVVLSNAALGGGTGVAGPASARLSSGASGAMAYKTSGSPASKASPVTAESIASGALPYKVSGSPAAKNKITPSTSFLGALGIGYRSPATPPPGVGPGYVTPYEESRRRIERSSYRRDDALSTAGPGLSARLGQTSRKLIREAFARAKGTTAYSEAMGMSARDRGGLSASDYAAGAPLTGVTYGQALKASMARAGAQARFAGRIGFEKAQMGVRRTIGVGKAAMSYMRMGAWDESLNDGKGGRIDVASQRAESRAQRDANIAARGGGFFARQSEKLADARRRMRIDRNNTRFGAANRRLGTSFGGRMGTSMGLGMLSQVAPEEMRGAMALGATVSQIDPRLGIAVAGIGGAMTAQGAGKGALSGAIGAGMLGAQIAGPYGALAGAIIGGVFGAIKGSINKGAAEMKAAEKLGKEGIQSVFNGITTAAGIEFNRNKKIKELGGRVTGPGAFAGTAAKLAEKRRGIANQTLAMVKKTAAAGLPIERVMDQLFEKDGELMRNVITGQKISQEKFVELTTSDNAAAGYLRAQGVSGMKDVNTWSPDDYSNIDGAGLNTKYLMENRGLEAIAKQESARMQQLQRISGMTVAELELLGQELGINILDPTIKFTDLVKGLGVAMKKTSLEMKYALTDILNNVGNIFKNRRESREGRNVINESSQALADKLNDPNLDEASKQDAVNDYMEKFFPELLAASGGDPMAALQAAQLSLGAAGKGAYGEGEVFQGLEKYIMPQYNEGTRGLQTDIAKTYAPQMQGFLSELGFDANLVGMERLIAGLNNIDRDASGFTQLEKFMKAMQGDYGGSIEEITGKKGEEAINEFAKIFFGSSAGKFGNVVQKTPEEALNEVATAAEAMATATGELDSSAQGLKDAIDTYNTQLNSWFAGGFNDKPEWWSIEAMKEIMGKDTTTPRGDTTSSRLSQTMARHAQMDAQLTGKRTVTSAFRTVGLGSINSDHVMGRAYDLTGQNLGQYATIVRNGGGFAEFHGTLGQRHLHVVPARAGDSSSPVPVSISGGQGIGGTTNNYNIEINGANQSPEQIANMVIAKITATQRNAEERL